MSFDPNTFVGSVLELYFRHEIYFEKIDVEVRSLMNANLHYT
jgi:hypothetical protein